MWKTIIAVSFLSLSCVALAGCDEGAKDSFVLCESTYALCTTAACTPADGSTETVDCACDVKTGYSAGEKPCTGKVNTDKGTEIRSRYYPIKSYAVCDNDRPWAWCLDKQCVVDKDDPTKASCACAVDRNQGSYLVVTDTYTGTTCTTNLWSSATVAGVNQITDFLKTTKELKPYDIKVLNAPN